MAQKSALVNLGSINRYHAMDGANDACLSKARWRHWYNRQHLCAQGEGSLQALREDVRAWPLQRAGQVVPPPLRIRAERLARQWTWKLLLRGAKKLKKMIAARGHWVTILATNGIRNDRG